MPGHGRIVGIAYGHKTPRLAYPAHLAKGYDRICEVLHQLMGVHDVERAVRESQLVDVPDQQPDISHASAGGQCLRRRHGGRCGINAHHPALGQPSGEIEGDGSGADADVQESVSTVQPRQQIRRRVPGGPPTVRSQDRVVVSMRIDLARRVRHEESVSAPRDGTTSGASCGRNEYGCAARGLRHLRRQRDRL
jgi:hypothetical protein